MLRSSSGALAEFRTEVIINQNNMSMPFYAEDTSAYDSFGRIGKIELNEVIVERVIIAERGFGCLIQSPFDA